MSKVTIKDIAKKLDMHHSTVSRALKDRSQIAKKTRDLVNMTALEMGYTPNQAALALRGDRAKTVAVGIPNLSHSGIRNFVNDLAKVLIRDDVGVVIQISSGDANRDHTDVFSGNPMAAVVIALAPESRRTLIRFAEQSGKALLVVDLDHEPLLIEALDAMLDKGARKPLLAVGCPETGMLHEAFKDALLDHYIPYLAESFREGISSVEQGASLAEELGKRYDKPDSVIFTSAEAAIGFQRVWGGTGSQTIRIVCLETCALLDDYTDIIQSSAKLELDATKVARLIREISENSSHMFIPGF